MFLIFQKNETNFWQNMDKINFKIKYYNLALEKGEDTVKKDKKLHTEWQQLFKDNKL